MNNITFLEFYINEAFKVKTNASFVKDFIDIFGTSTFDISNNKFVFTAHAMSRYIERDLPHNKDFIISLLNNAYKALRNKKSDSLFLVYSKSLEHGIVINKTDDCYKVVTIYPKNDKTPSKNTILVLTEQILID